MPSYTAQRRAGLGGRVGFLRAELRSPSGELAQVASIELAERLAELLGRAELPPAAPGSHPYRRFQLMHSPYFPATRVAVIYAGRVTSAPLVVTDREDLAQRIADLLNRVDFPVAEGRSGFFPRVGADGESPTQPLMVVLGASLGAGLLLLILTALLGVAVLGTVLVILGCASAGLGFVRLSQSLSRERAPGSAWASAHLVVSGGLVVAAGVAIVVAFGA